MFNRTAKAGLLGALVCGAATLITPPTVEAAAAAAGRVTQVELRDITTPLVPTRKTRGDREFGGGPMVDCSVQLYLSRDKRSVKAKIRFKAEETKGDRSTVDHTFHKTVYTAPRGRRIHSLVDNPNSRVRFRSKSGGFQILGPGEDFKQFLQTLERIANQILSAERSLSGRRRDTREVRQARQIMNQVNRGVAALEFQGNHVHLQHPRSGPVNVMAIVGDTGGDDISNDNNPKDDTRIQSIMFKPFRVRLQ